jgi:signal transduction histidine kinase
MRIEKLNLSARAFLCLSDAGIETVEELTQRSPRDLLALKSFGRVSLNDVNECLQRIGLELSSSEVQARRVVRKVVKMAGGDLNGNEDKAVKLVVELIQNAERYSRRGHEVTPENLKFHTSIVIGAIEELATKIEEKSK